MKKRDISEELWFRYLEGKTNEEETGQINRLLAEDDELLAEFVAVREAVQLVDKEPCQQPDLERAKEQINQVLCIESPAENKPVELPRRSNLHRYIAMAAAAALLVGVALFLLFRPDHNDNSLARQEKPCVETEVKTENQGSETTDKTELTNNDRKNKMSSNTNTKGAHSEQNDAQPALINPQKFEKNYTETKIANTLTFTKPSKNDYRVLCKNLEKSLQFEWTATNVQKLHFKVTNAQGKVLAELTDKTVTHYTLSYSKIYPERQLEWKLEVVYEDGAGESRSGHINIDYNINDK